LFGVKNEGRPTCKKLCHPLVLRDAVWQQAEEESRAATEFPAVLGIGDCIIDPDCCMSQDETNKGNDSLDVMLSSSCDSCYLVVESPVPAPVGISR